MSYINRGNRYGSSGGRGQGGFTDRNSGRSGERSMDGPRPVESGKEYNVEVIELSRRGDGVAKMQGFVIFVKGARVGDKVRIRVESVGPRFAIASVVEGSAAISSSSEPVAATTSPVEEVKTETP